MKYAKFSDDFLSDFRLDDNGETLVLTDKRGFTRAVRLLPYEERPQGKWIRKHMQEDYTLVGTCSICRERTRIGNFCRMCGADMRGGAE